MAENVSKVDAASSELNLTSGTDDKIGFKEDSASSILEIAATMVYDVGAKVNSAPHCC